MNSLVQPRSFKTTTDKILKWTSKENKGYWYKRHTCLSYIFYIWVSHVHLWQSVGQWSFKRSAATNAMPWFWVKEKSVLFMARVSYIYLLIPLFFRVIARLTRAWWSPHVPIKTLSRPPQVTPKIRLWIHPSNCHTFPCKSDVRNCCSLGQKLLPDKLEYSHYLLAGLCMETIGRSYMLISFGS